MKVGILGLQGTVNEHLKSLENVRKQYNYDFEIIIVKNKSQLDELDGIILPGGESTTISKLLKIFDLFDYLAEKIKNGLCVYGTCAGLILLANNIIGENSHLNCLDVVVKRNAFGSQIASFETTAQIIEFNPNPIPLVFIRAPWIESVGKNVKILAKYNNKIIAVRKNNILATSFHPEFTDDLSVHKYFIEMIRK